MNMGRPNVLYNIQGFVSLHCQRCTVDLFHIKDAEIGHITPTTLPQTQEDKPLALSREPAANVMETSRDDERMEVPNM